MRSVDGLILPADLSAPGEPAIHIVPENDPEEWVTQASSSTDRCSKSHPAAIHAGAQYTLGLNCPKTLRLRLPLPAQVFRSIDTESCVGFPTTNAEAYDRGLVSSAIFSSPSSVLLLAPA
jgi:hypothetical protein